MILKYKAKEKSPIPTMEQYLRKKHFSFTFIHFYHTRSSFFVEHISHIYSLHCWVKFKFYFWVPAWIYCWSKVLAYIPVGFFFFFSVGFRHKWWIHTSKLWIWFPFNINIIGRPFAQHGIKVKFLKSFLFLLHLNYKTTILSKLDFA